MASATHLCAHGTRYPPRASEDARAMDGPLPSIDQSRATTTCAGFLHTNTPVGPGERKDPSFSEIGVCWCVGVLEAQMGTPLRARDAQLGSTRGAQNRSTEDSLWTQLTPHAQQSIEPVECVGVPGAGHSGGFRSTRLR